jgi:hypothetical protein
MAVDFMAGAGQPAPPPGGAGPDLAALLGAGGPPPGPPPDQAPSPGVDAVGGEGGPSEVEALQAILMACHEYMAIPTVEESERLTIEQCTTQIQKLLAANEKAADSISGANPALRKALGTQG